MKLHTKNDERLAAWKIRYEAATGRKPKDEPYNVAPCFFCFKPVWRPVSMNLPKDQHFCGGVDCCAVLIEMIEEGNIYV